MIIHAHCKVNLFLDITGILPGGYHSILSVMHTAPIYDDVSVELAEPSRGIIAECSDASLNGSDNICHKAAAAFFESAGIDGGAHIYVEKRIPQGAGLGGGSADAAAVLHGLNILCEFPLSSSQLLAVAARVGADVPFCLSGHKCAVCEGIGEILTPIESQLGVSDIIIHSSGAGTGVSTKEAYAIYDEMEIAHSPITADELKSWVVTRQALGGLMYNVFEQVIFPQRPEIAAIKHSLTEQGYSAMMSGSGSAVFAVADSHSPHPHTVQACKN